MYSGALTLHAKTLKEISKKIIFGCWKVL
jgi:hypothetical protein